MSATFPPPAGASPPAPAKRNARRTLAESKPGVYLSQNWRFALVVGAVIIVVALVVGLLGGFSRRTDQQITVDPGAEVKLAFGDISLLEAHDHKYSSTFDRVEVTVQAQLRVTGTRQVGADALKAALVFSYTNAQADKIYTSDFITSVMADNSYSQETPRKVLAPDDSYVPLQFSLSLQDGVTPGTPLVVGLFPVIYTATGNLDIDQSAAWIQDDNAPNFWVVRLELQPE